MSGSARATKYVSQGTPTMTKAVRKFRLDVDTGTQALATRSGPAARSNRPVKAATSSAPDAAMVQTSAATPGSTLARARQLHQPISSSTTAVVRAAMTTRVPSAAGGASVNRVLPQADVPFHSGMNRHRSPISRTSNEIACVPAPSATATSRPASAATSAVPIRPVTRMSWPVSSVSVPASRTVMEPVSASDRSR